MSFIRLAYVYAPMELVQALIQLVADWYGANELFGMFLFIGIEEAGIPLFFPGDVLVMAAGVRDRTFLNAVVVCLVAALATSVGSSILFSIVRRKGRPFLYRYGRYLHLNESRIERLARWFRKHGAMAIVIGRVVPGMRTPTTVMAGLFDVPYRTFAPATTLAGVIWALMYFYLGVALERAWHEVRHVVVAYPIHTALIALAVLGIVALGVAVARREFGRGDVPLPESPAEV
jgi:membrane protein DedA with SNARE-associated domain